MLFHDGDGEDPWLAPDKLYHVIFCFSISLLFSNLASLSRYSFLRRHSIWIGSAFSLAAGAAKEAADQFGIFPSAGASARDAVADAIGIVIAALVLFLWKSRRSRSEPSQNRPVLPIWIPIGVSISIQSRIESLKLVNVWFLNIISSVLREIWQIYQKVDRFWSSQFW